MLDVRAEFPVLDKWVYLDVANKCAPPRKVVEALSDFFAEAASSGGDKVVWLERVRTIKEKFARLVGATPREIALVKNTSEGINLIANSFAYRRGDNVVISDLEHPNNVYPWLRLRQRGVEVRVIKTHGGIVTPEDVASHVDRGTKVVALSSVTCVSGARLDLPAISKMCREYGARLVIDAVQSLGILTMDVKESGIDVLAAGGYKGLLSPHGLGFLYCSSELLHDLVPPFAARASVVVDPSLHRVKHYDLEYRDDAGKFETGNYNYSAVWAGCVALDLLLSWGTDAIEARVLGLTRRLTDGLARIGLQTLGPTEDHCRSSLVSVVVGNAEEVIDGLKRRRILASPREGAVRLSFHVYNNEQDVDAVLDALWELARPGSGS